MEQKNFLERYSRFSEYLWLVVGVACMLTGVYFLAFTKKQDEGVTMFLFTALASGMYGLRRVFRRRMERLRKQEEEQRQNKSSK